MKLEKLKVGDYVYSPCYSTWGRDCYSVKILEIDLVKQELTVSFSNNKPHKAEKNEWSKYQYKEPK